MGIFGKDGNQSGFQPLAYSFIMVRARRWSLFLVKPGGCITHTRLCLAMLTISVIRPRAAFHFVLLLAVVLLAAFFDSSSCSRGISKVSLEGPGGNRLFRVLSGVGAGTWQFSSSMSEDPWVRCLFSCLLIVPTYLLSIFSADQM